MNLTAPITLLAALTAVNNPASDQKPVYFGDFLKCYNCGEKLAENTWCNHPRRNNVPSSGTTVCDSEEGVCAEAVYTVKSTGLTAIERRCSFEQVCAYMEQKSNINLIGCQVCKFDLCNKKAYGGSPNGGGIMHQQLISLVPTFVLTILMNLI